MHLRSGKTKIPTISTQDTHKNNDDPQERMGTQEVDETPSETSSTTTSRFSIRKVAFLKPKDPNRETDSEKPRNSTPPPIIVPHGANNYNLKTYLETKLRKDQFVIKNLNNATQIQFEHHETRGIASSILEKNHIQYYTYRANGPEIKKFVLYDLTDQDDINDITSDLLEYGLHPIEIKPMRINQPRYKGHANFIVHFDTADRISLSILSTVKYICSTSIRWAHFKGKETDVIQCFNCCRFGHFKTECHMKPVCLFCSESHTAPDCPLLIEKLQRNLSAIPEDRLKCANCKGNHTAKFQFCPAKLKRIDRKILSAPGAVSQTAPIRQRLPTSQKSQLANTKADESTDQPRNIDITTPLRPTKSHQFKTKNFPSIKSTMKKKPPFTSPLVNNPVENTVHYKPDSIKPVYQSEYYNTVTTKNDLFTPQELTCIFQEMLSVISSCNNKTEQLNALMNLTIKYLPCQG